MATALQRIRGCRRDRPCPNGTSVNGPARQRCTACTGAVARPCLPRSQGASSASGPIPDPGSRTTRDETSVPPWSRRPDRHRVAVTHPVHDCPARLGLAGRARWRALVPLCASVQSSPVAEAPGEPTRPAHVARDVQGAMTARLLLHPTNAQAAQVTVPGRPPDAHVQAGPCLLAVDRRSHDRVGTPRGRVSNVEVHVGPLAARPVHRTRRVSCLVDFFNVAPRIEHPGEVDDALNAIFAVLRRVLPRTGQDEVVELDVRLYGGWVTISNAHSQVATWVLQSTASLRGLYGGYRILPSCALTLAEVPNVPLVGTLRQRGQKMVDTMICLDILYYAASDDSVVVMSDDDDMIPALLVAASRNPRDLRLVRRRAAGLGKNDHCLSASAYTVSVHTY